ncbi:DNA-binding protein [Shewanella xiamenensis]|uniref:DNA-binding protein n=1 Tax=Shewanella xiamenensis TaxID=332186 RepID=UPI00217CF312|nr:DNA-binding protein [Shewanella xiamenensis]MCT8858319.1 DNA-binding protein [Shewanella xiamenensis]UWG65865.1 DNA-binding protein [Shewanella xiamenensis]
MSSLVISIPAPYVTYQKYADDTGLKLSKVQALAREGRLPILPKRSANEAPLINMVALMKQANDLAEKAGI